MEFKDSLRQILNEKGVTPAELSRRSGVTEASISYYLSGRHAPSAPAVGKLAKALNVSADTLLQSKYAGKTPEASNETADNTDTLTADEKQLIDDYRELSTQGKEYIRQTMSMAKSTYKKRVSSTDMEAGT